MAGVLVGGGSVVAVLVLLALVGGWMGWRDARAVQRENAGRRSEARAAAAMLRRAGRRRRDPSVELEPRDPCEYVRRID